MHSHTTLSWSSVCTDFDLTVWIWIVWPKAAFNALYYGFTESAFYKKWKPPLAKCTAKQVFSSLYLSPSCRKLSLQYGLLWPDHKNAHIYKTSKSVFILDKQIKRRRKPKSLKFYAISIQAILIVRGIRSLLDGFSLWNQSFNGGYGKESWCNQPKQSKPYFIRNGIFRRIANSYFEW